MFVTSDPRVWLDTPASSPEGAAPAAVVGIVLTTHALPPSWLTPRSEIGILPQRSLRSTSSPLGEGMLFPLRSDGPPNLWAFMGRAVDASPGMAIEPAVPSAGTPIPLAGLPSLPIRIISGSFLPASGLWGSTTEVQARFSMSVR